MTGYWEIEESFSDAFETAMYFSEEGNVVESKRWMQMADIFVWMLDEMDMEDHA
jgi:hypothetical protein